MFLFCFTKILNQAFLHDSRVSLHSWLLWSTVRRGTLPEFQWIYCKCLAWLIWSKKWGVFLDLDIKKFKVRVNHTIKHNGTKNMILISVFYQNASTSRIQDSVINVALGITIAPLLKFFTSRFNYFFTSIIAVIFFFFFKFFQELISLALCLFWSLEYNFHQQFKFYDL